MLARNLWTGMIAGPEMENETWTIFKTTGELDEDSLRVIQQLYYGQLKPVVSELERAELQQRYQLTRKEQT